jgi:hypothetical protein
VLLTVKIRVEETWMRWIVDSRQQISVHVVHGFTLQKILGKTQRLFAALSHSFPPVVKDSRCFR